MNRISLVGCWVALVLWALVAVSLMIFGPAFYSIYEFYAGAIMLAIAVAALPALRLIRSYQLRRFVAADIVATTLLLGALALAILSNQQLGSPSPARPPLVP